MMKPLKPIAAILLVLLAFSSLTTLTLWKVRPVEATTPITRVQGPTTYGGIPSGAFVMTLASIPTNGNLLILTCFIHDTGYDVITSITESGVTWSGQGNPQVQKQWNPISGQSIDSEIWVGVVGTSASTSVTVHITDNPYYVMCDINEYAGLLTSSYLDKTQTNNGTSQSTSTGTTATTAYANELWIGTVGVYGSYWVNQSSPTGGFTLLDGTGHWDGWKYNSECMLERIVAAVGVASSGTTLSNNNAYGWSACIATFIGPAPGGTGSITRIQGNYEGSAINTNVIYVTMGTSPTAGNLEIAAIATMCTTIPPYATVSTITQTNVAWSQQTSSTNSAQNLNVEIWAGVVSSGAVANITITLNKGVSFYGAVADICEYSGLSTTNYLDRMQSTSGSGTATSTGTTSTTNSANELWIGAINVYDYTQTTPTNSFSLLDGVLTSLVSLSFLERMPNAFGQAYSGTSITTSSAYAGTIATFYGAGMQVSYTNVAVNTTSAGSTAKFSTLWDEPSGNVSGFIFSSDISGTMTNDTWQMFPSAAYVNASSAWSNVTKTLPSFGTVHWSFYCNDSTNNWFSIGTQSFTITVASGNALFNKIEALVNTINYPSLPLSTVMSDNIILSGIQFGQYTVTQFANYVDSLPTATTEGSVAYRSWQILYYETLLMTLWSIQNQTTIEWALDHMPFLSNGLPDTGTCVGFTSAFWVAYRFILNGFYWSQLYSYDTSTWNINNAYASFKTAVDNAPAPATEYVTATNGTFCYWGDTNPRYYDESAETLDAFLRFYQLGISNALSEANNTWTWLNVHTWTGTYYQYFPGSNTFECEAGGFDQIALKFAYYYPTLPYADRILTDIHTRFLASEFASPQWSDTQGSFIRHARGDRTNAELRMQNTLMAWGTLFGSYNAMSGADQTLLKDMLAGIGTPSSLTAWQYMFTYDGSNQTPMYFPSTDMFLMSSQESGSGDIYGTTYAASILISLGIVPINTSIAMPIIDSVYEDVENIMNARVLALNLSSNTLTLPISQAGSLKFIYGTTSVTQNFSSSGLYAVQFAADYNSVLNVTRLGDLPSSFAYYQLPVSSFTLNVLSSPNGVTVPSPSFYTESLGTNVSILAVPNSGYALGYWWVNDSVQITGTINPYNFTMTGDTKVQPIFTANPTLTIYSAVGGATNPPASTYLNYTVGSSVTITATPSNMFSFWFINSSYQNTNNPLTFLLTGNTTIQPMFSLEYENCNPTISPWSFYGSNWVSQTFITTTPHSITTLYLYLGTYSGSPIGTITASIENLTNGYASGSDLTSGTVSAIGLTSGWYAINMTEYNLTAGTQYAIVIRDSGDSSTNCPYIGGAGYNPYSGGFMSTSQTSGSSWTPQPTWDIAFQIWGHLLSGSNITIPQLIILSSANGWTNPIAGTYTNYTYGQTVNITAFGSGIYTFDHWKKNNTDYSSSNPLSFTITEDTIIQPIFALIPVTNPTLTIKSSIGGTTTPLAGNYTSYAVNSTVTISETPSPGFTWSHWLKNGSAFGSSNPLIFNITEDTIIEPVFTAVLTLTILPSAPSSGGTTTPPAGPYTNYTSGDIVTVYETTSAGYSFSYWLVNGLQNSTGNPLTFNITSSTTVQAVFSIYQYVITATAGDGGTISPTGTVIVNYGFDQTFTMNPSGLNTVLNVKVDGTDYGAILSFIFHFVQTNHTISVTFTMLYLLTLTSNLPQDTPFTLDNVSHTCTFSVPYVQGMNASSHVIVFSSTFTVTGITFYFWHWTDNNNTNPARTVTVSASASFSVLYSVNPYIPNSTTPLSITFPGVPPIWQYLANADILGFIVACYVSIIGEMFYAFVIFISFGVLYLKTKSVVLCSVLWLLLGGTFITLTTVISPIAVILVALGITGMIYRLFTHNE